MSWPSGRTRPSSRSTTTRRPVVYGHVGSDPGMARGCSGEGGEYGRQPSGILEVESVTKRAGVGTRGFTSSRISSSSGRRFPLRRLQGAQEVTTFSHTESPPRERGTT